MKSDSLNKIWMAVTLGILVATAPNWLLSDHHQRSSYEAPWIYPADLPSQSQ